MVRMVALGLLMLVVGLEPRGMVGQGASAAPETFEVASIKPSAPDPHAFGFEFSPGGRLTITAMTVQDMVSYIFKAGLGTVSGGPGWVRSEHFDVSAKMDETEAAALEKIPWKERDARIGLMLRALLEERFKLKVREETKVVPVYALVLAKGGPKAGLRTAVPSLTSGPRLMMDMNGWKVTKINMDELAAQISLQQGVERIVVNETGLKGDYCFDLFWSQADGAERMIPTLVEEQLGLKLEPRKAPEKVFVIEAAEQPSAN